MGRAFNRVCLFVCLFVSTLNSKRLKLSTPNLVHIYSIVVARRALTQRSEDQRSRSHGYENRHGHMVASVACCYGVGLHVNRLRLPMFSSYYYFFSILTVMHITKAVFDVILSLMLCHSTCKHANLPRSLNKTNYLHIY